MDKKLKKFLDQKVEEFNQSSFIISDPICIPHLFTKKQDIEIAGFFAAIFAWGNRTTIINKSKELMNLMDNAPYDFCLNYSDKDLKILMEFKHRTFNTTDLLYFIEFFKHHYANHETLEDAFFKNATKPSPVGGARPDDSVGRGLVGAALNGFYEYFFSLPDVPARTKKHIATPVKRSTCKRLNMFLRWMVRQDENGVDFGIWKKIKPAQLIAPIDVHVARVARKLHLLQRKQTDWQAALELTDNLKKFDPNDPVKYDFALFGLGVVEKRSPNSLPNSSEGGAQHLHKACRSYYTYYK